MIITYELTQTELYHKNCCNASASTFLQAGTHTHSTQPNFCIDRQNLFLHFFYYYFTNMVQIAAFRVLQVLSASAILLALAPVFALPADSSKDKGSKDETNLDEL